MGFLDFFKKKEEPVQPKPQIDSSTIEYYEMEPSKASCQDILSTTIPSKTYEASKPKRFKFTSLSMKFLKKNV